MKNSLYSLLLVLAIACKPNVDSSENLKEFQFPHRGKISDGGFLQAFVEKDSVKVGEIYRAKVFLGNRHLVYNGDSIEPIIRYHYKDSITWGNLYRQATLAKVINDTAYIKFTVSDGGFKKGTSDRQDWKASIQIPRAIGDTSFFLSHELIIKK